jgi:hypothetical protein
MEWGQMRKPDEPDDVGKIWWNVQMKADEMENVWEWNDCLWLLLDGLWYIKDSLWYIKF